MTITNDAEGGDCLLDTAAVVDVTVCAAEDTGTVRSDAVAVGV